MNPRVSSLAQHSSGSSVVSPRRVVGQLIIDLGDEKLQGQAGHFRVSSPETETALFQEPVETQKKYSTFFFLMQKLAVDNHRALDQESHEADQ